MKKIFAILLAVTMLASMATVVSAANTTTLTTTVPAATYTLNIPADQEVAYGATQTDIGTVTITDAAGFAVDKNVEVTVDYDGNFVCEEVSTKIPYTLGIDGDQSDAIEVAFASGSALTFYGKSDGTVGRYATEEFGYRTQMGYYTKDMDVVSIYVNMDSTDWGKALGGEYTATITFTAEVVAG